ncbi:leucine-rich repeat protein [Butyrivibrio sp. MB2005]|uniref:leucine-rich repeat protein n=1 Tax=Butyrivibrio sp. MB2005 TaxID=1280678 RepID=UPI0009DC02D6
MPVDNTFKGNQNVKNVTIGKNIKTVGAGAFSECPNLKNVDMSKCKVTSLSKNLFKSSKNKVQKSVHLNINSRENFLGMRMN